ncbi:MAG TPA: hypothetical protein VGS18_01250, partial [Thermoplasmata archaeon]|nr:hypothetical protein [Thermoplasmata archaeon]
MPAGPDAALRQATMNRSIVLVGGLFVVGAFVLFSYPIATTGHETLGLPIELGVFLLGEGLG